MCRNIERCVFRAPFDGRTFYSNQGGNYEKKLALFLSALSLFIVACNNNDPSNENCKHNIGYDGFCSTCEEYIPTNGVVYQVSSDGKSAEVCGYDGTDAFVVIAKEYNDLPVTTITRGAFENCDDLTGIVVSENIITINGGAFNSCNNLTNIVLGENITTIHDFAFSACFKLVEIYNKSKLTITANSMENGSIGLYAKNIYTEPQNSKLSTNENGYVIYTDGKERELITYLGTETDLVLPNDITKINPYAFRDNDNLTSIIVGNQVNTIGNHTFALCDSLKSVTLSDSVNSIGNVAFANCVNLNEVIIGKNLKSIGEWAFSYCKLTSITVDKENSSYMSIDGNLYTKDGKNLLQYAIGKTATTFTIPNSVTVIDRGAFRYCENLTSVIIGDNVLAVDDFAFDDCNNLTNIEIGNGVNFISDIAFNGTQLLNITVDEDNSKYMSEEGNLYSITNGNRNLKLYASRNNAETFIIPDDIHYISRYAFSHCNNLINIVLGDNVSIIGEYAFNNCKNLTSVKIGSGVTTIDKNAFFQCENLTNITVDENNEFFMSINGDLYTKDGELLFETN